MSESENDLTFPPESPDDLNTQETGQIILTPDMRVAFLGRLAEFELQLAALTERQQAYVLAVLEDPTSYEAAARKAGFAHPSTEATRLRHKPRIAALIALGEQLREDRTFITSDRTLHELAIIAFSDIRDFRIERGGRVATQDGVPLYATRAVSTVKWDETRWVDEDGIEHHRTKTEIRLWPKVDALKMIALYQKLLSGADGAGLTITDKSKHVHIHQHQNNTWAFGDNKITF